MGNIANMGTATTANDAASADTASSAGAATSANAAASADTATSANAAASVGTATSAGTHASTHPLVSENRTGNTGAAARTRILVVEHEADAGVGLIGERIQEAGAELVLVGPEAGRDIPASHDGFDGVIVLGGTPGPTDDDAAAWLPRVRELIGRCLADEVPFLGVCLGAQMLAVVAGGVVAGVRKGPEIGLSDLALTAAADDDALLGGLKGALPVELKAMQWHWLEVHELPEGSISLCTSQACPNQAFRVGPVAWGLQFHLEALTTTAEAWAADDDDDLRELGLAADRIIDEVREHEPQLRKTWSQVADRWLAIVAEHAERAAHAEHAPR